MLNIRVNKIYKLKKLKDNNPLYVYCLFAPPSHQNGMILNQKCIGITMTNPEDAVAIYTILTNKNDSHEKTIQTLNNKYGLVTFWSVDAVSEFKDRFVESRETQDINRECLYDISSIKHYAQFRLDFSIYKRTVDNFKNYNKYSNILPNDNDATKKDNEIKKIVHETLYAEIKNEYKGYLIKNYNKILFVNINGSFYYVYSPIYLCDISNKQANTTYIGIVLELGSILRRKRKSSNVIQSILNTKKNNDKNALFNILNKYLSMNSDELNSSNHLFKFNHLLFKENKHLKETKINYKDFISSERLNLFAQNAIDILDSLPDYINAQIRKNDKSMLFSENYNGITIPYFFKSESQTHNNCYIRYKTGEIGFKVRLNEQDVLLKFKIPSIDNNFKTVPVNSIITVNVTKWYSENDLVHYGMNDERLASEILTRIKQLYNPISDTDYSLFEFFNKVDDYRKHSKIKSLYDRIKATYPFISGSYKTYCKEMKYLRNYIENPHLITSNEPTNSVSTNFRTSDSLISDFNYKDYKGTNGIFYSLSNEYEIINSNISLNNIKAQFIKKFAYVPNTDFLKKLFSLLVVDVNLNDSKLNIECYGAQKMNYSFNINVSAYSFSFSTIPKENAFYYSKIIAAVCNKVFQSNQHNPSRTYRITNKKDTNKQIVLNDVAVLNCFEAKTDSSGMTSEHQYNTSSTNDIHFRRGHWHYYWYGHRNSPDRYRKLKWINETIVNRNASIVVIQL